MVYWWQCVYDGNVAKAKLFLKHNIDMHLTREHRQTAVHYVCLGGSTTGHVRLLRLLLGRGADMNAIDDSENTPLHFVAIGGYTAMCRVLLKAGANTLCYNLQCKRPADVARHWKRRQVYEMLTTWRAAIHWRRWTQRRKRQRERRYLLKVWYHKGLSCDFRYLVCWL